MENELMTRQETFISIVSKQGIGEMLKPLTREIHLFDTYIAGTTHLKDPKILDALKVGDKLQLQREDNKFDENAILVLNADREKLGYIPEKDNIIFSRLLDAGKLLNAQIGKIEQRGGFRQISIGIFLIDF